LDNLRVKIREGSAASVESNSKDHSSGALVEAEWLVENLANPDVAILEVYLTNAAAGEVVAHIPNARRVNWKNLIWESKRREFADSETLAERLGELGIPSEAEIVICGDPIQFGTYAFMALKMAGNRKVKILNGGKARWIELGLPLSQEEPRFSAAERASGSLNRSVIVGRDEVLASLGSADVQILDVRSDEEYRGERVSPLAAVIDNGAQAWGRIPGAKHLAFTSLLGKDGRFLERDSLVANFASAGVALDRPVFLYCRLGHRASLAWFTLSEIVGFELARVYDGSWTEWGSMVGMPIER
jgi:thiosulfate/3-mercaptopyruvate sulfurtransferase